MNRRGLSTLARRAGHGLLLTLSVVCIGSFLLLAVGPRTGRFQVVTVLTGSMAPSAPRGSLAVVAPKPVEELEVGDVLTYAIPVEDRHVVTHRVVELDRSSGHTVVRTKGDANGAVDPWTATLDDETVWTERFALPRLGQAIVVLRGEAARRLGQLAPLLLALMVLARVWRREAPTPDALAT